MTHALRSSNLLTWVTPPVYIEAARDVLGGIDLDPASSPRANQVVQADRCYSLEAGEDGLLLPWYGRVWLNPPYGRVREKSNRGGQDVWSTRLLDQYAARYVGSGILLVNAVPDRVWFQPLWSWPIVFTDHRILFLHPETLVPGRRPTHGSAFVYIGRDWRKFIGVFRRFGHAVVPDLDCHR